MDLYEARRHAVLRLLRERLGADEDDESPATKAARGRFARETGLQPGLVKRYLRDPSAEGERKRIGDDMAQRIERVYDLPPGAVLMGGLALPDTPDSGRLDEPPMVVDQLLSRINPLNTPRSVTLEQLMEGVRSGALPSVFTVTVWDDSMGDIEKGGTATLRTNVKPVPGKPVLVKDRAGNLYLRDYRPKTPAVWTAHARNPAWASLDSQADGLEIVAVMTGFDWFRAWE